MDLKYSQVAKLSNFSNDKMVNLIKTKIAESENAAVALVFDDKLILLDESNNQFWTADYNVKDNTLNMSNWDNINLLADNDTRLEKLSESLFDPISNNETSVKELVEAFKLKFADQPVKELINETLIEKKSITESNSKIKALNKVRSKRSYFSDDIADIFEDEKINTLLSSISENSPVQATITKVDFSKPLSVSILGESSNKLINLSENKVNKTRSKNIKSKVMNMWTSESFKKDFANLVKEVEDSDDIKNVVEDFINQHKEILILESAELEDLILKTSLMVGEAKISDSIIEIFNEYYELDETKEMREDYISRNKLEEEEGDEEGLEVEEPEEDVEKVDTKDKKEASIDEDSINKILKVLNKIKENLEEKTLEAKYITSFIGALEDAKVGSIAEGKLKEILDFLNSIYEEAKEKDEEGEE